MPELWAVLHRQLRSSSEMAIVDGLQTLQKGPYVLQLCFATALHVCSLQFLFMTMLLANEQSDSKAT